jgi:hypothetical protein
MGSAGRFVLAVSVLAAGAMLVAPPSAQAAVTIGSDLSPNAGNQNPCAPVAGMPCTIANLQLPGEQVTAPFDGVVVRWRVEAVSGDTGTPVRLRVVRDAGGSAFTAVGTSATRTIPMTGLETFSFATRLPIAAGEQVALDVEPPSTELLLVATAATVDGLLGRWQPELGSVPQPPTSSMGEATFNADVEPDTDGDGFGDESQDDCPGEAGSSNGCETTPPETIITKRPQSKVKTRRKKKKVRFKFVSSEPGSVFRCDTDEDLPAACRSPYKRRFPRGKHDFEVVAIDAAGNADPTPATVEFRVKRKRKRR